jgi:small subunit ribosomal protein S21
MPTVFLNPERQSQKDIEFALRKLKKKVEAGGILKTLHEKSQYEKPTTKRKRKKGAAVSRHRRELMKQQLPPKMY